MDLSAIGVAYNVNGQNTEAELGGLDIFCEQDNTSTGRQNGHPCYYSFTKSVRQVFRLHQTKHRRRLSSRHDERIHSFEFSGCSNRVDFGPHLTEHRSVSCPVSLEGQHAICRHPFTTRDERAFPPA